jgi:hypothetical protein
VRSLALARDPLIALLSDTPWVHDQDGWSERPFPEALRRRGDEGERLQIFFGRDYQPRVMGSRWRVGDEAEVAAHQAVYLRWQRGGWRPDPKELGPLGASSGGLFGVLGIEDPEVVCRPLAVCVVKRTSGWLRIPATSQPVWMTWVNGEVFASSAGEVLRLGPRAWERPQQPPPGPAVSVWANGSVLKVAIISGTVHHWAKESWLVDTSAPPGAEAVWGLGDGPLWLAGGSFACHGVPTKWRCRNLELGSPVVLTGRSVQGPVFLGGSLGLWRAQIPDFSATMTEVP